VGRFPETKVLASGAPHGADARVAQAGVLGVAVEDIQVRDRPE
jgi:hypothetical protein